MKRLGWGVCAGIFLAVSLGPFAWIVLTSFKSLQQIDARPPEILPDFEIGFYRLVFGKHNLVPCIWTSAVVAIFTTLLSVGLGTLAAYSLARLRVRFRRVILGGALAASIFPQLAIASGIYQFLTTLGLLGTRAGLVLTYTAFTLPFSIWMLTTAFREIPGELEEAAAVDGCGPLDTLVRVFLPVAAPSIVTAAILVFICAWNEFFFALMTGVKTLPVGIAFFSGEHTVPWGELSAAAVVATLPLVILVLGFQRRIVGGLTAGAVKG